MSNETLETESNHHTGSADRQNPDEIRNRIERSFYDTIGDFGILKESDIRKQMATVTTEALVKGGAKTSAKQVEWLLDTEKWYKQDVLRHPHAYEEKMQKIVDKYLANEGLTEKNVDDMKKAFSRRGGDWKAVEAFFTSTDVRGDTLAAWEANWKEIAEKHAHIERLQVQGLILKGALPSVDKLDTSEFKGGKVLRRLELVDTALSDAVKYAHGREKSFSVARVQLRYAVENGGLSATKVDAWLAHIFAKPDADAYVQSILPGRVTDWVHDGQQYASLLQRAKQAGIPAKEQAAYLALSYEQRHGECVKLERSIEGTPHPMLSQIDVLIENDEFDEAQELLSKASGLDLTIFDKRHLFHLERKLEMERGDAETLKKNPKESKGSPDEQVELLRSQVMDVMEDLPYDLYEYFAWAMREGGPEKWDTIDRLRIWLYNIKWAHDHGFIPDQERYGEIQNEAEDDTERINEEGHRNTGVTKLDMRKKENNVDVASRKYDGGQSRGPMYVFYDMKDPTSRDNLRKAVKSELTNTRKNYWGLAGSVNVKLDKTIQAFEQLSPKLKALKSAEKAAGRDTESIPLRGHALGKEAEHALHNAGSMKSDLTAAPKKTPKHSSPAPELSSKA